MLGSVCTGHIAAGGDCRVSLCVCVESSNLFGAMHLVSSCEIHTVALCAEFGVFLSPSICSQIDLDIYIVRFDCNTTSGREWGQGRAGQGELTELLISGCCCLINSNCERALLKVKQQVVQFA